MPRRLNPRHEDGVLRSGGIYIYPGDTLRVQLRGRGPFTGALVSDDGWEATLASKTSTKRRS